MSHVYAYVNVVARLCIRYNKLMPKNQTKKTPSKIIKPLKIFSIVALALIILPISLWLYNYVDMRVDKPLGDGDDFAFIQQDVSKGPFAVPTETFYYATNVPPQDFSKRFPGWKVYHMSDVASGETLTTLNLEKDEHHILVNYSSRSQFDRDPLPAGDFKGKQYILFIRGASMYFLNPNNIHSSMKQSVLDEIKSGQIR